MGLELGPLHLRGGEVAPSVAWGDGLLDPDQGFPLVGHLEEQEEGELLEVVLVREPVVSEDVAVRPELLDDAVGVGHGFFLNRCPGSTPRHRHDDVHRR